MRVVSLFLWRRRRGACVSARGQRRTAKRLLIGASAACLWLPAVVAGAHPLAPLLFELVERDGGRVDVTWRESSLKLPGAGPRTPRLPAGCNPTGASELAIDGPIVTETWTVDCGSGGLVGREVGIDGLASGGTDALLRVRFADGRVVRRVLGPRVDRLVIPERESRARVVADYAVLGVEHILGGFDHLLFVFGLLLLVRHWRPLVATITAFTVGHSITLALAVLGIATVPSGPVEVLIALSVFLLAVELARAAPAATTLIGRRPWLVTGSFGLLHGLGFAGALAEAGLPENDLPLALFAFNVGIEVGQIAFVAAILAARTLLASVIDALPPWTQRLPIHVMGSLAAMWTIERALALLG